MPGAAPSNDIIRFADFDTDVKRLSDEFKTHLRMWGPVITHNAQSWRQHGLPVDDAYITGAAARLMVYRVMCSSLQLLFALFYLA